MTSREVSERADVARETLRTCERDPRRARVECLERVAHLFDHEVLLAVVPMEAVNADLSTAAISMAVIRDGFESWKIHFMNLVDQFRRMPDLRLVLLPPVAALDPRLGALLASIVCSLCEEAGVETPSWATREYFLKTPWFVAGVESLKAMALVESPLAFRRNNIFVLA